MAEEWETDYEEVRLFFKEVLEAERIDLSSMNTFTFKDKEGKFGLKGVTYKINILTAHGKVYLIELKSFANADDVDWFFFKTSVIAKALGFSEPIRMFMAVTATDEALERAKEYGIKMLAADVIEKPKPRRSGGRKLQS
ncbi:hypothetical protein [Metallosphaera hakonensis]|nr:hypothetical protein [Metallosphaera hakonensis]AWS00409.2 hypothetical protein DFR87_12815 [Metallosphaera hakonensis JCM 8857 = DSM 7519]